MQVYLKTRTLLLICALCVAAVRCDSSPAGLKARTVRQLGPQFSAEWTVTRKTGNEARTLNAKIYANLGLKRVREEGDMFGSGPAVILWDYGKEATYILRPGDKTYTEIPLALMETLTEGILGSTDPCELYRRESANIGGRSTCRSLGESQVEGFHAVEYEVKGIVAGAAVQEAVWVDPATGTELKLEGNREEMEMTHIRESAQPPSLFYIPSGYRKVPLRFQRAK